MRPLEATPSVAFKARFHATGTRPPVRAVADVYGFRMLCDASERDDRQMPPSPEVRQGNDVEKSGRDWGSKGD